MTPPRWVLDTNVVLSALLFPKGRLVWLREGWREGRFTPVIGRATVNELMRTLGYPKFALTAREREDLLADYVVHADAVAVPDGVPAPECRDPHDRAFLELAVAGRAGALVTGDADLLALAPAFPVPIINPAAAREKLRAAECPRTP